MGLKAHRRHRKDIFIWGWNQTKMGLKEPCGKFAVLNTILLKSDQDGIESQGLICGASHKPVCWNQTKMGLKGFWTRHWRHLRGVEIRPRWDWKTEEHSRNQSYDAVEIRPRWDWKQWASPPSGWSVKLKSDQDGIERSYDRGSIAIYLPLKSDQDGIERLSYSLAKRKAEKCWNQTKMGLKDTHANAEAVFAACGWNQTKMGLKVTSNIAPQNL